MTPSSASQSPGDFARGMEPEDYLPFPQPVPLKASKALEEGISDVLPLSTMMMIVIVTLALLLVLLSLIFFLLLHQQRRKRKPEDNQVALAAPSRPTQVYQNMFISMSRIYQNQKPRAPTPPPSPMAQKRPPPPPPPMKMEETHHTYTNHDFKKGTLKELQNEETNPNHQPSAPPIVPKQNLQFFDKLQQQAPSNLIGGQQANKKIKTRSQGGKVVSYSNVKRPKKEGPPKETGVQKEANPNDPGEPGVMNLRETVGGYEEMTEENQTVPIFGPQTVWEKAHLNQQLD